MSNGSTSAMSEFNFNSYRFYRRCSTSNLFLSLELFLCLVGLLNTGIIVTIFTRPHMRHSSMNLLLAGIEISNFLAIAVQFPQLIFRLSCPVTIPGSTNSAIYELFYVAPKPFLAFTNWTTPVIGIWRFVAEAFPLHAHIYLTKKLASRLMAVIATYATLFATYIFLYRTTERSNYTDFETDSNTCAVIPNYTVLVPVFERLKCQFFDREVYLTIAFTQSVIPCAVSLAVTAGLIVGICNHLCKLGSLTEGQDLTITVGNGTRITCVLIVYLLAHTTCYVFPELTTLLVYESPEAKIEDQGYFCFLFFHFPMVVFLNFLAFFCYLLMSTKFRETFCEIFRINLLLKKLPWNIP